MKYTRSESNEVVEVKGCTTCPHMVNAFEAGNSFMFCTKPQPGKMRAHKKLIGRWTGPYHESCPLPRDPNLVPENPKTEKTL